MNDIAEYLPHIPNGARVFVEGVIFSAICFVAIFFIWKIFSYYRSVTISYLSIKDKRNWSFWDHFYFFKKFIFEFLVLVASIFASSYVVFRLICSFLFH